MVTPTLRPILNRSDMTSIDLFRLLQEEYRTASPEAQHELFMWLAGEHATVLVAYREMRRTFGI